MKISKGFTIVEFTIALSVSAIVLATGYELFKTLRSVGDKQDQFVASSGHIINVLDRIREDLIHSVPKAYGQEAVFVGNNINYDSRESKLLQFYSLCVTDQSNEICGIRQVHKIAYDLVKEKDSMSLHRTAKLIIAKDNPSNDQDKKLLVDEIDEIKIFFHNGNKLESLFSSKQYLPVYVEIELTAYGQTWLLAVKLPCSTVKNME